MKTIIKKITQIIIFILIFILIILANFAVYKNINKIISTHQNEIYTFNNDLKDEKYNFLYEMCLQLEEQEDYKKVLYTAPILKEKNNIVFNIIKSFIFQNEIKEDTNVKISLCEGELQNTVYGNLKFLSEKTYTSKNGYSYTNYYIVHSEDMKKICFYNLQENGAEPNNYSIQIRDDIYYDDIKTEVDGSNTQTLGNNEDINSAEATKNKEEIIKKVKEKFSNVINNIELKPDTIIKKTYSYILQDEENDITIYYDNENNNIFGFYMGFGN